MSANVKQRALAFTVRYKLIELFTHVGYCVKPQVHFSIL